MQPRLASDRTVDVLGDLPQDVLARIFVHLSPRDVVNLAITSAVVGKWRDAGQGDGWQTRDISDHWMFNDTRYGPKGVLRNCVPSHLGEVTTHQVMSSYQWCILTQVVDLQSKLVTSGLTADQAQAYLECRPSLHFSTWYSRANHGKGIGEARLILQASPDFRPYGQSIKPLSHSFCDPLQDWQSCGAICSRLCEDDDAFQRISCTISRLPRGMKYACVVLLGRDSTWSAGHFGMRFAIPRVTWGCGACEEPVHVTSSIHIDT
ncbi:hypothetical protein WJX74_004745 [Apatococcus lobatus]|uniref:F-box domain-containing protein n=1 Tax=Apatococcus lobatus TaxID=904363 RepID=A0AAW1RS65_9CHLO